MDHSRRCRIHEKTLESKEYIFCIEYLGRRRATVAVNGVPSYLLNENLAAYMLPFRDIAFAPRDSMRGLGMEV